MAAAGHDARVFGALVLLESATEALLRFVAALPPSVATDTLVGGWTPAAHVWHVALTNDVFSGVLRGDGPITAASGDSDFTDAQWSFNSPPPVEAPGILMPPADASPSVAAERLHDSATRLRPLIEALDPSRGIETVQLPWGRISVYQMTEWAAGHTLRHLSQVGRELQRSAGRLAATS
jgi:hypothetical protein